MNSKTCNIVKDWIVFSVLLLILQSCSLFNRNICKKLKTDSDFFRSNSEATSSNTQLAQEKALLIAKKNIIIEIDNYLIEKFNYKDFLVDSEYENKITITRKAVLNEISIVCNKNKNHKENFKNYVAIEISKKIIDEIADENMKRKK
ncbi:MAG: hypothetical protein LBV69_08750 [Bacteroidales bacterium]|nr:hypothetical protein [Bacteroidales bacterium]